MDDAWIIPLDGINYLCWGTPTDRKSRKLTENEERDYFNSSDKEKFLSELLSR